MKSKLEVQSVKFEGDLTERAEKTNGRRKSVTPKIVVCPPIEEMTSPPAPHGAKLLRALSKKLSRRSDDIDSDGSSSSSSSESVSCEPSRDRSSSSSASDSNCSDSSVRRRRHRSTISLRRIFQGLSLTPRSRSQSFSSDRSERPPKKQQQPKRILRPPVTYTYVRGISGLPTQRVPRYTNNCYASGLGW